MNNVKVKVFDTSGVLQAELTDFNYLAFTRWVNRAGLIELGLRGDHDLLGSIGDKWQFEIWQKTDTVDWVREISGIYRYIEWKYEKTPRATIRCDGILSMLGWRTVAWYAGYTDRSQFIGKKAETIANTLVKYNATSSATAANGRDRDGAISGLTVESDGGGGNTLDWYCARANLLETLQKLALVGGGDFDLIKTSSSTYEWRWYDGQLGSDKTSEIIFAMDRDNMQNPVYINDRQGEKTVAIVGGKGEGSERAIEIRTSSNYNATSNNIETFVGATDVDTTAGLQARGDGKLAETKAIQKFEFDVIQIDGCQYQRDYQLGDLVSAINPFTGDKYSVKIEGVSISFDDSGNRQIKIETGEPL